MRILLTYVPHLYPPKIAGRDFYMTRHLGYQEPLGILYLAGAVEQAFPEAKIKVYDGQRDRSLDAFRGVLRSFRPDVAGFCIELPKLYEAVEMAETVRELCPGAAVVAGGPLVTMYPEEAARLSAFDGAVAGQAEIAFPELLRALAAGRSPRGIGGVWWKGDDGQVEAPPGPAEEPVLESLPHPARHLLHEQIYFSPADGGKVAGVLTSRGCPFRCGFCANPFPYRARSPESVADEFELLAAQPEPPFVIVWDECFNASQERVEAVCDELIRRKNAIPFAVRARTEKITAALARRMYQAGARRIQFGLEATSDESLRWLGKGTSLAEARKCFEGAAAGGLRTGMNIILGLPHQGIEEMEQTLRFVHEVNPDFLQVTVLALTPKSPLFRRAAKEGKVPEDLFERYMAEPEAHFIEPILGGKLPPDEIFRWMARAYRGFYMRPSRILQELRHTASLKALRCKLVGASQIFKLQLRAFLGMD